jgi:hypothetical protein
VKKVLRDIGGGISLSNLNGLLLLSKQHSNSCFDFLY